MELEQLRKRVYPSIQLTQSTLRTGPAAIESERDIGLAVPGVVRAAIEAEHRGVDAVVINCMADPGLLAARESVRIPVVGPAQAAIALATQVSDRFAVIGTTARDVPMNRELWRRYGVEAQGAGVRIVDVPVLDLITPGADVLGRMVSACVRAVEDDGAGAVIFGCNYMSPMREDLVRAVAEEGLDGLPIIDPLATAFHTAELLAFQGVAQSRVTWPSVGADSATATAC